MGALLVVTLALWVTGAHGAEAPIRIGLSAAMTGELAEQSRLQLQGMRQFTEDLSQRGALLGRQIELVVYDDGSTPEQALANYRRLIETDGISLLISPYSSTQTLAIRDYLNDRDVVMIALNSAPQIWQAPTPRIFGLFTPADENMRPLLDLARSKNLRTLALAYLDADFPAAVASGVRRDAPDYGLELIADQVYPESGADFTAQVRKFKAARPDVVVIAGYLEDSLAFAAAARAQRLAPALLAFSGAPALREFGDRLGDRQADGMISSVQWMRSVGFPGSFDFAFRFRQQHGVYPSYESAAGYAALQVLEAAIRLAGTTDPEAVRATLGILKFRSILGHFRVDEFGRQTAKRTYLVQWQDSHISLVYPEDVARWPLRYPYRP
jgi:branched-chain amino acid transport system substrate-binding protein